MLREFWDGFLEAKAELCRDRQWLGLAAVIIFLPLLFVAYFLAAVTDFD
jgi:hypothetical protein